MNAAIAPASEGHSNTSPGATTSQVPASETLHGASLTQTASGMEYAVAGEDIDPQVLNEPGWKKIRQRAADAAAAAAAAAATPANNKTMRTQNRKKKSTSPPEEPLPTNDIKIVLRPQGGLNLTQVNPALLADTIFKHANLTNSHEDQVRINKRSNFIVISTPSEARAQQYLNLPTLPWNNTNYALANHIPPPSTTVTGAIFQVPPNDDDTTIMDSLIQYNPTITVLEARRIRGAGIVQVLFLGPLIPFWVRYRAVILRCYPFKRKAEACMACWKPGHRRDVCPNPSPQPHCTTCGTPGPTPNHPCRPQCILCGDAHVTGAAGCPKRFQPLRKTPAANQQTTTTVPPGNPSTTAYPPLKRLHNKTYSQAAQSSVGAQGLLSTPPSLPPSQTPTQQWQDEMAALRREMQTLRHTITLLRQENERLTRENAQLKQQVSLNNPQTPVLNDPSQSPPLKRRAAAPTNPPSAPVTHDAIASLRSEIETAFTALKNQTTEEVKAIQATVHELHQEMLKWMQGAILQPVTPPPAHTPLGIPIEHDNEL